MAQGYLQMPVAESDINGICDHLMEMCLGDQQFVTLLLYINNICVFVASIDEMLDQIELFFSRLKEFD